MTVVVVKGPSVPNTQKVSSFPNQFGDIKTVSKEGLGREVNRKKETGRERERGRERQR